MSWPGFEVMLRHRSARYQIKVENPDNAGRGVAFAELDGAALTRRPLRVRLRDDGANHYLVIRLGF
jgi:cyclic beta-1,2-glucan synthetase